MGECIALPRLLELYPALAGLPEDRLGTLLRPDAALRLPAGSTVGALRERLVARGGRHAEVLARGRAVRCALDRTMSDESAPLHEGAEVAFFPPVTGG
jgi:molybdopterin synthase sulfur carrier subunit